MPIAINKISFKNGQDEVMSKSTNTPVFKVKGSIRRTPGDSPLLKIYLGKRDEYQKNKAVKVDVDTAGNFVKVLEFQDEPGQYFITAELLCDDNSYDFLTETVYFKEEKPTIDDFNVVNADSVEKSGITYDTYYFNSFSKSTISLTFASNPVDSDLEYFYKIWLSCDTEPASSVPLSYGQNFTELSIALIENGDYFVYFKVLDSAGNFTTAKRKISIAKISPDVTIAYLQIVSNDYFVTNDNNSETKLFRLLVNIIAGIKINRAELRLYKDNKMITMKTDSSLFNKNILKQLQASGSYFLEAIDISNWGLTYGTYEVEIYYKDVFNVEYTTNRTSIYVKDRQPKLYCNQLDTNNPASLILDAYTELEFFFDDPFFNFRNKQISVSLLDEVSGIFSKTINSKTSTWEEVETGVYKTTLKLYFSDDNIKKIGDRFFYQMIEFKLDNDYSDVGLFTVPIIYKAEKNKIVLHEEFIRPVGEFQTKTDGFNVLLDKNLDFRLLDSTNSLYLKMRIINDVSFGELYDFTSTKNEVTVSHGSYKTNFPVVDCSEFYLTLDFNDYEFSKVDGITLTFETNEISHDNNVSYSSFFNCSFYSNSDFVIPNKMFKTTGLTKKFLEPIPKNFKLTHSDLITENHNDFYQTLSFKSSRGFFDKELKNFETKEILFEDNDKILNSFFEPVSVCFYRDLSNIFSDVVLGEVVYDDKFDFSFLIPFKKISEELVFFIDSNKEYSINNVSAQLENFSECDKQSSAIATTKLVFDSEKLAASNFVFLDNQLKACNVVTNQVTFVFEKELSNIDSLLFDINYLNKTDQLFKISEVTPVFENNNYNYTFTLTDGFSFEENYEYDLFFYSEPPSEKIILKNINVAHCVENGSVSSNVYYKYKDFDEIYSFKIYYDVFRFLPSLELELENETIFSKKFNRINVSNKTFKTMAYKKIEIFSNDVSCLNFTEDFLQGKESFSFGINDYNFDGSKKENVLYLETAGNFNAYGSIIFIDPKTNKEYEYKTDTFLLKVQEDKYSYDLFLNDSLLNFVIFDNSEYEFYVISKRKKNFISGYCVQVDDSEAYSLTQTNIFKTKQFEVPKLFNSTLADGVHELKFFVKNLNTNVTDVLIKEYVSTDVVPTVKIQSLTSDKQRINASLQLTNDVDNFNNSKITFLVKNALDIKEQTFFNFTKDDVFSFELPFDENIVSVFVETASKIKCSALNNSIFDKLQKKSEDYSVFGKFFCASLDETTNTKDTSFMLNESKNYNFYFDLIFSPTSEVEFLLDDIDISNELVRSKNTYCVVLKPNSKSFTIKVANELGVKFYGPFLFEYYSVFSSFKNSFELFCTEVSLFEKSVFLEANTTMFIENCPVFFSCKVSAKINTFARLIETYSFLENYTPEQKMFFCFSANEFLKCIDSNKFASDLLRLDFFNALVYHLYKWSNNNSFQIPFVFNLSFFNNVFGGFNINKEPELMKVLIKSIN